MTEYSLDDIEKMVNRLASKIGVPDGMLPNYGAMKWDSHPFIEIDDRGWMYHVVSERGNRRERLAIDLEHLLYLIFDPITFQMACNYEVKNRITDKDSRRLIFEKQEELLGYLSGKWRDRKIAEHKSILFRTPFDDLIQLRVKYWGELNKQGFSRSEIERLAYEKYPKNNP